MRTLARTLSLLFAAGAVGALANSITVWALGTTGITGALGVAIAPQFTPSWLYPRLVWGGVWGALFLIPFPSRRWLLQGFALSLVPTFVQLVVIFPEKVHKGLFGLELGTLTPLFVLLFNAVWGVAAALWLRLTRR